MRHLAIFLLLATCCVAVGLPISARDRKNDFFVHKAINVPIQLTTAVVTEKSCSPNHLSLDLRFSLRNVSDEPVLIDKRSFVARSLVSRSLKAANAKQYVTQVRADLFDDLIPSNPTDLSNFVVVRPGEAYDLQSEHTRVSFLINEGRSQSKDLLGVGNYFLQVDVATWSYLADANQFRRKWQQHGLLWFEGLTSQPMPFTVKPNREIASCR